VDKLGLPALLEDWARASETPESRHIAADQERKDREVVSKTIEEPCCQSS